MFNIAICDDEPLICSKLESMVEAYKDSSQIKTEVFYSGEELYDSLNSREHYDLIFLDIELKVMNGMIIAQKIRNELCDEKMHIVFISGKQEYAMELFAVRPLHFLIKPLTERQVFEILDKALELSNIYYDCFEFKCGKEFYKCYYGDIIYFESNARKIIIHTNWQKYIFYGKLNDIEKQTKGKFLRIHQSYLVNPLYISRYKADEVTLLGDEILPISKNFRGLVKKAILEHR